MLRHAGLGGSGNGNADVGTGGARLAGLDGDVGFLDRNGFHGTFGVRSFPRLRRLGRGLLRNLECAVGKFDHMALMNEPMQIGDNGGLLGRRFRFFGLRTSRRSLRGGRSGRERGQQIAAADLRMRVDVLDDLAHAL